MICAFKKLYRRFPILVILTLEILLIISFYRYHWQKVWLVSPLIIIVILINFFRKNSKYLGKPGSTEKLLKESNILLPVFLLTVLSIHTFIICHGATLPGEGCTRQNPQNFKAIVSGKIIKINSLPDNMNNGKKIGAKHKTYIPENKFNWRSLSRGKQVEIFLNTVKMTIVSGQDKGKKFNNFRYERIIKLKFKMMDKNEEALQKELKPGMEINAQVSLHRPRFKSIPGGFDEYNYALANGCWLIGRINKIIDYSNEKIPVSSYMERFWHGCRLKVLNVLKKYFPADEIGLIAGMGWGEKTLVTPEIKEKFKTLGILHMLVVSGAHLLLVLRIIDAVLKRLPLKLRTRIILSCAFSFIYAGLCGFEPAIARAVLSLFVDKIGRFFKFKTNHFNSLCVACFLYLLFQPYRVFNWGFLLSVGITTIITLTNQPLFFGKPEMKRKNKIFLLFKLMLLIQLFILPFNIHWANKVSPLSLVFQYFGGLIAMIIIPFALVLFIFTGIFGAIALQPWGWILQKIISGFKLLISEKIIKSLGLIDFISLPAVLIIIAWGTIIIYLFRPQAEFSKNLRYYWRNFSILFLCFFSILLFYQLSFPDLKIYVFDVGQGDAILLQTRKQTILVDSGRPEDGEKLVTALRHLGVEKVDLALITHEHADHFGGAFTLLEEGIVKSIAVGGVADREIISKNRSTFWDDFISTVEKHKIPLIILQQGDKIKLSAQACLDIYYPKLKREFADENNNSLITVLKYYGEEFLLTGDAEKPAEEQISTFLHPISGLKVGHHGGKNASGKEFLAKITPQFACISVGQNNYGHPAPVTLARLREIGCKIYRTDLDGTIVISYKKGKREIKTFFDGYR